MAAAFWERPLQWLQLSFCKVLRSRRDDEAAMIVSIRKSSIFRIFLFSSFSVYTLWDLVAHLWINWKYPSLPGNFGLFFFLLVA